MEIIQEQEGVFAQPIELTWGQSSTGREQCAVTLKLLEGPDEGRTITAYLYFTQEGNTARSIESLQHCGCTFPDGDIFSDAGFGSKKVRLVIEHEEYEEKVRAKVKWINSSGGGAEMDDATKASFAKRMKHNIALAKTKGGDVPW